jgi:hypothetical protein
MKKINLLITAMVIVFTSCSIERFDEAELKAVDLVADGDGCETGFTFCAVNHSTCFIDAGFNRWGWSIGPLSLAGLNQFVILPGAADCDTSGEKAGKVTVDFDPVAGTAEVKFTANEGYSFQETHLYIGETPFPLQQKGPKLVPTVAPGQYPYQHENLNGATMDSYSISGLPSTIYVIAHTVVCKDEAE